MLFLDNHLNENSYQQCEIFCKMFGRKVSNAFLEPPIHFTILLTTFYGKFPAQKNSYEC